MPANPFPIVSGSSLYVSPSQAFLPPIVPRAVINDLPPIVCRAVFEHISVHANGDIVCSCADAPGLRVYGNVYRDRIADVFRGPMYRAIRQWQLVSNPDSWCPVINMNCSARTARATALDDAEGGQIRLLQLEPTSRCNLRCPSCHVTTRFQNDGMEDRRDQVLPLEVMLNVIDQLPYLETMLFYNYGESFLHKDAIRFLREVRRRRPDLYVGNCTNGLVFTPPMIEAIAGEALLNRIVFAIDGAQPESYPHYRVGGSFQRAIRNLEMMARARDAAGTRDRMQIVWQYILFEWNDTDEELAEARRLACETGVVINWVATHTEGASKRYTPGSAALASLPLDGIGYTSLTCEIDLKDFIENRHVAKGKYLARISANRRRLKATTGSPIPLTIFIENLTSVPWFKESPDAYRIGALLRDRAGRKMCEIPVSNPLVVPTAPSACKMAEIEVMAPAEPGDYQILLDVVEEGVCWFFERGSQPLVCPLMVGSSALVRVPAHGTCCERGTTETACAPGKISAYFSPFAQYRRRAPRSR